jgi:ketosteroid isomerase-like protein
VIALGLATALACVSCASSPGARSKGSPRTEVATSGGLRRAAEDWARASNERNGAKMGEYFADDVIAMYPRHSEPTIGGKVNRDAWVETFAIAGLTHPLSVDSVAVSASGDMGYTYGRWHLTSPAVGKTAAMDLGGHYVAVWRPVGEARAWRIVMLSANEHRPAPAM